MRKCIIILIICFFAYNGYTANHQNTVIPFRNSIDSGIKIRVATYNIRANTKADVNSGNGWDKRKIPLSKLILEHDFDIVGTQEGNFDQMNDLMSLLSGYDYIGYPYGGTTGESHTASIVYKKTEFKVLDQGEFWYSETPNIKSIGWDATDLRICTWAKMEHLTSGQQFYFFTSHFYWRYQSAKHHSGKVMVHEIKKIATNSLPVISVGDLNSGPTTLQIADIESYLQNARKITETLPSGPDKTGFHGGVFKGNPLWQIDYIFVNDRIRVLSYAVLTDAYDGGKYPSDHLPVVCDLFLKYR